MEQIHLNRFYNHYLIKPIAKPAAVPQYEKQAYEIQKATDRLDMEV